MLDSLQSIKIGSKKRVGRGKGSNKGKTSGRGMNGQRARNHVRAGFEGGQARLIKRLRVLRGKGFKPRNIEVGSVNLAQISKFFKDGDKISLASLKRKGLVKKTAKAAKVLGVGELKVKVQFADHLRFSKRAQEKVS
ncbi:50S ribosomal protein L15 [candidate division WWE3 bacterium]|uniref:Large ribosomal subunit protein uL15 n=1 Tax=candidate division WWE3 bacterium TaxID=2053526 RepID=A0A955RQS7_UNCKA|nr:50S ribosomal protein L15 [candidate division WWE3 bacterium]